MLHHTKVLKRDTPAIYVYTRARDTYIQARPVLCRMHKPAYCRLCSLHKSKKFAKKLLTRDARSAILGDVRRSQTTAQSQAKKTFENLKKGLDKPKRVW